MKFPTDVKVVKVKTESGVLRSEIVSIVADKQVGHDLALALLRLEQTTLHFPDSIRDLRLRLSAELIHDPQSVQYIKGKESRVEPVE